jgi:uncharacterized protein
MRAAFILLFTVFASISLSAQDITGPWYGVLKVQGIQLRLVFNITKTSNGLSATMDSPDQGVKGMPITTTSFENSILKITIANAAIDYEGTISQDNKIIGTFKQGGQSFPLNLSKEKIEKIKLIRPQEPTKPYPYYTEDITFENKKAGISLAGTLTLPQKEGVFPMVILISGSGPQDRNEELFGHKPFLVLADYLTKNGIGVLRYDDRGIAKSKGNFAAATTADFANDVESALEYLKTRKEVDKNKIGLIGHSEGGLVAPIVASKVKEVAFIVLLAGSGIQGDQILLLQKKLIEKALGFTDEDIQKGQLANRKAFDIVNKSTSISQLKIDLKNHFEIALKDSLTIGKPAGMSNQDFVTLQVNQIANPWMQYFINYNPAPVLEKVKCPVLAINGEKDLQVPPKENLEAIKKALTKGKNKKVTFLELPNLNHLFQECKTGSPEEYASIEQTFSPVAMAEILNWLQKVIKK